MSELLKEKSILVVGGGGRLGLEICKALAQEGVSTLLVNYRTDRSDGGVVIQAVNQVATNQDIDARTIEADISTIAGRETLFAVVDRRLKALAGTRQKLDVAINAAGIIYDRTPPAVAGKVRDFSSSPATKDEFVNILELVIGEEAKRMDKGGRIINLANGLLDRNAEEFKTAAQVMTAHAVEELTIRLSRQFKESGIQINSVSPGFEGAEKGSFACAQGGRRVNGIERTSELGTLTGVAKAVVGFTLPSSAWITGSNVWSTSRPEAAVPR